MKYEITRKYKEIELSSGAVVHCRPVPPYAVGPVAAKHAEPPYPYLNELSVAGGSERRPALVGTEQWIEWQRSMQEHRRNLGEAVMNFSLNYGVVDWQFPGMDESVTEPPDDWTPPAEITQLTGITVSKDPIERRVQFIKYELILTDADADAIEKATTSPTKPVTRKELAAAISPFDSDVETVQP